MFNKKLKPQRPVLKQVNISNKIASDVTTSESKLIGVIGGSFGLENKKNILDFARINSYNIDFFTKFSCYYRVFDFFEEFSEDLDFERLMNTLESSLKDSGPKKYDVIFLWDILNYLNVDQSTRIFEFLKDYCHWKTYVYCMFGMRDKIPRAPMKCYVSGSSSISYRRLGSVEDDIKNNRVVQSNISKITNGFVEHSSTLLKSGIKETTFMLKRPDGI